MIVNNLKITDIQYFGDIYFNLNLSNIKYIKFNNALRHFKGLHVNRTSIMGANKVLVLSVPLDGGRSVKTDIKDLKIVSRESWQRIHWRSIHDSYRKSPWFEEYAPELEKIYRQNYIFLWDWNLDIARWVFEALNWDSVILAENELYLPQELQQEIPYHFIKMEDDYPVYQQVFSDKLGFQPNLSILDLIMNEGPASTDYLQKLTQYHLRNSCNTAE
jgi:hypothetical protein